LFLIFSGVGGLIVDFFRPYWTGQFEIHTHVYFLSVPYMELVAVNLKHADELAVWVFNYRTLNQGTEITKLTGVSVAG
jgi:hypothetical protein